MDKYVVASVPLDESETLTVVKPLDGTFRHDTLPLFPWGETAPHVRWPRWPVKQAELFVEFPGEKLPCGRSLKSHLFHSPPKYTAISYGSTGKRKPR
jgi:hypothetical protein